MVLVLSGAPWLIAHRTMLGINRPYRVTLNGTDYVLWQSADGTISALENSCPHTQAPLSEGWVCRDRNTITCPFHALEFDSTGRFIEQNPTTAKRESSKPLAKPLKIIVRGDFIWTYGNEEPELEIPSLHETIMAESFFVGAAGDRTIETPFLNALMINYDFNHAASTHRDPLNLQQVSPTHYREKR